MSSQSRGTLCTLYTNVHDTTAISRTPLCDLALISLARLNAPRCPSLCLSYVQHAYIHICIHALTGVAQQWRNAASAGVPNTFSDAAVSVMLRFISRHLAPDCSRFFGRIGSVGMRYELVSRVESFAQTRSVRITSLFNRPVDRQCQSRRASVSSDEVTKGFFVEFDKHIRDRCCRREAGLHGRN